MDPQLTVMAQTASATVVALMATDVWQHTRDGVVAGVLHCVVVTAMTRLFAGEEFPDDPQGLLQHLHAHRCLGPHRAQNVFVERFARPDSQPEPPVQLYGAGGRRLRSPPDASVSGDR
jgi:hypothetical protein